MQYLGELLSLVVAVSWTATAIFAGEATRRIGTLPANIIRMAIALLLFGTTLTIVTGTPMPFSSTMIRGITGLVGVAMFFIS